MGLGRAESDPGGDLDVAIPEVLSAPVPALHGAAGLRRRGSVEPPGLLLISGSGSASSIQVDGRRLLPDQALHNAGTHQSRVVFSGDFSVRSSRLGSGAASIGNRSGLPLALCRSVRVNFSCIRHCYCRCHPPCSFYCEGVRKPRHDRRRGFLFLDCSHDFFSFAWRYDTHRKDAGAMPEPWVDCDETQGPIPNPWSARFRPTQAL